MRRKSYEERVSYSSLNDATLKQSRPRRRDFIVDINLSDTPVTSPPSFTSSYCSKEEEVESNSCAQSWARGSLLHTIKIFNVSGVVRFFSERA